MTVKKRKPKPDDQQRVKEAVILICQLVNENKHIDPSLWFSACICAITQAFINSGAKKEKFLEEIELAKNHYSKWFDD